MQTNIWYKSVAVLFIIAKRKKKRKKERKETTLLSTNQMDGERWYIHTMEYYSGIKENEY